MLSDLRNSRKTSSVALTGRTLNPVSTGEYRSIASGAGIAGIGYGL